MSARGNGPGQLARAELRFLLGVGLAGLDKDDATALSLIESAIKLVDQSATSLPHEQRQRFSDRFADWKQVLQQVRN